MSAPTTSEEYTARFSLNMRTSGCGVRGVTQHFPCPFCAAPDWYVVKIIDFGPPPNVYGATEAGPFTCAECGRSGKFIHNRQPGSVTSEFVQTGGDDPPPFMTPPPRRVEQ